MLKSRTETAASTGKYRHLAREMIRSLTTPSYVSQNAFFPVRHVQHRASPIDTIYAALPKDLFSRMFVPVPCRWGLSGICTLLLVFVGRQFVKLRLSSVQSCQYSRPYYTSANFRGVFTYIILRNNWNNCYLKSCIVSLQLDLADGTFKITRK